MDRGLEAGSGDAGSDRAGGAAQRPAPGVGDLLAQGAAVGGAFGFLETLLALATGNVPVSQVPAYLGFGLACGLAAALALAPLARLLRSGPGLARVALIALPAVAFAARGPWRAHLPERGLGVALVLAAALALGGRARTPGRFLAVALSAQGLGAFLGSPAVTSPSGLAALGEVRWWFPGDAFVAVVAVTCAGVLAGCLLPRRAAASWMRVALTAVLSFAVGAAVTAGLFGAQRWVRQAQPPRRPARVSPPVPNVLLVTLSATRRDHLSCYGYARRTSPRIDDLAARSIVYEQAYTTSTYALPAHASLFTGLLPSAHGARPAVETAVPAPAPPPRTRGERAPARARRFHRSLSRDAGPTLAERMSELGHATAGVSAGAAFFAEWSGLTRGFGAFAVAPVHRHGYRPLLLALAERWWPRLARRLSLDGAPAAGSVTDAALAWLDGNGEEPFFLFLNYSDPLDPLGPPAPYDGLFPVPEPPEPVDPRGPFEIALQKGLVALEPPARDWLVSRYDGQIAYADAQVGRVLDWLRARDGLFERTLVVVTADHGTLFGEHGLVRSPVGTLHEEQLRVPLVVKLPGQTAAQHVVRRVGLHQVAAIVAAGLSGQPLPVEGAEGGDQPQVLAEAWTTELLRERNPGRFGYRALRAVYQGPYKLVQADTGREWLHDLVADPGEATDLLETDPRAREVRDRLAAGLEPVRAGGR